MRNEFLHKDKYKAILQYIISIKEKDKTQLQSIFPRVEKCFAIVCQVYPLMEKSKIIMRILFLDWDKDKTICGIIFPILDKDKTTEYIPIPRRRKGKSDADGGIAWLRDRRQGWVMTSARRGCVKAMCGIGFAPAQWHGQNPSEHTLRRRNGPAQSEEDSPARGETCAMAGIYDGETADGAANKAGKRQVRERSPRRTTEAKCSRGVASERTDRCAGGNRLIRRRERTDTQERSDGCPRCSETRRNRGRRSRGGGRRGRFSAVWKKNVGNRRDSEKFTLYLQRRFDAI